MSDFNGDSVGKAAEELVRTSGNWRQIVKHNAAVQSLYLGDLRRFLHTISHPFHVKQKPTVS